MVKMRYVGPGVKDDMKPIEVEEAEVQPLEKTGLWEKVKKKASSQSQDKKEGE